MILKIALILVAAFAVLVAVVFYLVRYSKAFGDAEDQPDSTSHENDKEP